MAPQGSPGPSQPGKVIEVHYQRAYCLPETWIRRDGGTQVEMEQQMWAALW